LPDGEGEVALEDVLDGLIDKNEDGLKEGRWDSKYVGFLDA